MSSTPLLPGSGAPPPSAALLSATAACLVLVGNTGQGLPAVLDRWVAGADGAGAMMASYLPLHLACLAAAAACLAALVPAALAWWRQAEAAPDGLAAPPARDPRWDNCKFFLTMIIAQGHFQNPWWGHLPVLVYRIAEDWWIMPTYCFISGYLSSPEPSRSRARRLWTSVAVAFAINQMITFPIRAGFLRLGYMRGSAVVGDMLAAGEYQPSNWNLIEKFWYPDGLMWYLSCLLTWRLLAPFWIELKYPLATSLLVMVGVPYATTPELTGGLTFLAWDRVLGFLPWYVLGLVVRRDGWAARAAAAARWRGARRAALVAHAVNLACNGANVVLSNPYGDHTFSFVTYAGSMDGIQANGLYTMETVDVEATSQSTYDFNYATKTAQALAWYGPLLGAIAKAALIYGTVALAPTEKIERVGGFAFDLTRRGADSIVNYLFHYYVIYALCLTGVYEQFTVARYALVLALAPAFAQVWMSRPVAGFLKATLIFPDVERFLLSSEPEPDEAAGGNGASDNKV